MRHIHGVKSLGQGADLVDLHQDGVGQSLADAGGQSGGVGDEQVVADDLAAVAQTFGQHPPAVEIILGATVLDRDDGEAFAQVGQIVDHGLGLEGLALPGHDVFAVLEEFRGRDVEAEVEILAGQIAGGLSGPGDEAQRLLGRGQVGGEAALVADVGVVAGVLQLFAQGVEDLRAHAQGLGEAVRPGRQDHELLDVDRIVGMGPAVDDVHHRGGQDAGRNATQIAVQRQARGDGAGLRAGQADAEDGVGAQPALVLGAVQRDQGLVDTTLVLGVHAAEGVEDLAVDVVDRLADTLAAPQVLVAVAQFHRLMGAGRGTRGHGGAAEAAVVEDNVHLDGGIAAAVENLAGDDVGDVGHEGALLSGSGGGFSPTSAESPTVRDSPRHTGCSVRRRPHAPPGLPCRCGRRRPGRRGSGRSRPRRRRSRW